MLGGYDIFKEAKIRRFWGRQLDSKWRPLLLKRLYPHMDHLQRQSPEYLGQDRVLALLMPEADSSNDSLLLGRKLAETLGIRHVVEDISLMLQAAGCYRRRDDAIRSVIPEYGDGYRSKIVLPNLFEEDRYAIFSIVVQSSEGEQKKLRLPLDAYLSIVAATELQAAGS